MSITYNWNFGPLECIPSLDGLTDVVKIVHWRYIGTDGTYSENRYGSVGLDTPSSDNFISFNDLTETEIIEWITPKLHVSVEEMQQNIETSINNQKNPPIINKSPPWMS
ncbi:hypothetical protein UFOVP787_137 [uncultured Caudovirales phage]|uniref:DUF7936 domain-containing protein n=1 Tax=uncultured Caudovirales phage TaxID=2100421 RepID=A0A6J5NVL8_9CAUD|nr:hypothetical protein UFOVP787_137 [uncultured Caudovirales phage]